MVERLFAYHPDAHLYRLLDWHEHDGFISVASPSSWQELHSFVGSTENIQARFRLGDTDVREGFFPAERDYYLRFYVPDVHDNPFYQHHAPDLIHYGTLDVTGPEPLIMQIAVAIEAIAGTNVNVISARAFFDLSYSG